MNEYCDLNDEHAGVAAAVRAQRDRMPMAVPVERIISRGRTVRNRRRIPTAAALLATAGAAVFAVTALGPPAARSTTAVGASSGPATQLAAWTVDESRPGEIVVTVRQLHDPAGLQARLRADGVAAVVTFSGSGISPACLFVKDDDANALPDARALAAAMSSVSSGDSSVIVLHPAAIPSGDGVFISVGPPASVSAIGTTTAAKPKAGEATPRPFDFSVVLGLVHASPQCTGN